MSSDLIENPNLPSNSNKSREKGKSEREEPEKIERVTQAKLKKKSWADSFAEAVLGEDGIGSYILYDVLVPAAKSTISDMITNGIEMLLYGEPRRSGGLRRKEGRQINYGSFYKERDRRPPWNEDRDREPRRNRARHRLDEVLIETRSEAEEVLDIMRERIDKYDTVSVADFCELVDIDSDYTDRKYGWENLNRATVQRVRGGYIIDLPNPVVLD